MLVSGLVQGAHSSVAAHVACVRMVLYCSTCGTQRLRHTPGVWLKAVHDGGMYAGSVMNGSGTQ